MSESMSYEDSISVLAQTLHTAWRKGADCEHAHPIWKLISDCEDGGWSDYLDTVNDWLYEAGYRPVSPEERRAGRERKEP
jgi:hypothetical protein